MLCYSVIDIKIYENHLLNHIITDDLVYINTENVYESNKRGEYLNRANNLTNKLV